MENLGWANLCLRKSSVIEDITTRTVLRKDTSLCFAYYNYRDTRLKDLHLIVAALIQQLCRRKDRLPIDLLQTKRDALSPSLVYVVFDALDECPEQERGNIIGFITGIVTIQSGCQVKVFVTSRYEMDIAKAFGDMCIPTIHIRVAEITADIEVFARSRVEKLMAGEHGKTLYVASDRLKDYIIETLVEKAEGMFLWVDLQLDSLCQASKARKDRAVEAALEELPQGLPNTYVHILERIEAQPSYMRDLALSCLAWIVYARRPLYIDELQYALAINSQCTVIQDLEIDSTEVILEACSNLLEINDLVVRPIHYTVQEFLAKAVPGLPQQTIRAQLLDSTHMHKRLSVACLTYMRLVAFDGPAESPSDLCERLVENEFVDYAYHSFDYHVSKCDKISVDVNDQLETLLRQKGESLAAIMQVRLLEENAYSSTEHRFNSMDFLVTSSTVVYSTILYNIPTVRQKWVGQTIPAYALHLAASAGLNEAVVRLLEAGCRVEEVDSTGSSPLYYACLNGALDTVQLLIDNKADVNVQGGYYGNALQAVSRKGYEQIVKVLLNHKADVNAEGGEYSNALQAAAYGGYEQTVRILLDYKANVNAQGGRYGNALQAAVCGGYKQIVKMLLDHKADVNAQGGERANALQAASLFGHEQIVKMLLDHMADVNAQGGGYGTALQAASSVGHERVVKILLDHKADVNARGEGFNNALQAASFWGHKQVVKILLDHKADVNAEGGDHGSALEAATYHPAITSMLRDAGAEPLEELVLWNVRDLF
ncbi:ankyrin repeat-containing domain protein [Boeremia exigua]|uniref:ankyrin repeat-containing domain protein n=1 Tax=Boeremia exigua TaxID=749465 RepID=UPI001E8D9667|nr:ankyrin repeat-containing domain protein [Boeremia exigua]KAH6621900.1 ankyrin repeat-containing domain protein [Boeremia exigua]